MAGYSPAKVDRTQLLQDQDLQDNSNLARAAQGHSTSSWSDQAQQAQGAAAVQQSAFTNQLKGIHTSGYAQAASRVPVTREDLIEVALKLQEAASLVTQAISRLGAR